MKSETSNQHGAHTRKLRTEEIAQQRLTMENVASADRVPVIGLLDNIRSLYNVGSMFRTADGAFLQGLYLTGYTPSPPRKEIAKTALGAVDTVPWKHFSNPMDALAEARDGGARICVLEQTTHSRPYCDLGEVQFPLCLVVGNELNGIQPGIVDAADFAVDIPMYGTKHSLNAAVAFGIAVFEFARVWRAGRR